MSDHGDPGTEELERRLDAAFQATRPRRGFEDELWARLQARRPWWRRVSDRLGNVGWAGVAAGLVTVAVAGLVLSLGRLNGPHSTTSSTGASIPARSSAGAAALPGPSGLPFGRLPAPPGAGVVQAQLAGGASALPAGTRGVDGGPASPPTVPPSLPVYRFGPAGGPGAGSILDPGQVPAGLQAGYYASRQPADALAAAAVGSGRPVTLTGVRLAYAAVVSAGQGYLEPVYVYTGTAGSGPGSVPVQLVLSALDPAALQ